MLKTIVYAIIGLMFLELLYFSPRFIRWIRRQFKDILEQRHEMKHDNILTGLRHKRLVQISQAIDDKVWERDLANAENERKRESDDG